MAKIVRSISAKTNSAGESEILLRLTLARTIQLRIKSGIFINRARFEAGQIKKPRANQKEAQALTAKENELIEIERLLITRSQEIDPQNYTKAYFEEAIDRHQHPDKYKPKDEAALGFFGIFEQFLSSHDLSEWRRKRYQVLKRALLRFEAYQRATGNDNYKLSLGAFDVEAVFSFDTFLREEHTLCEQYPDIYAETPADTRKARKRAKQEQRGNNTIVQLLGCLRAFFNWANKQDYTTNRPFDKFDKPTTEHYGTPYYLTQEERNQIAITPLASTADAAQRDIFIFQCLIGCRVSDLMRLTPADIVNGAVEYIPEKTRHDRARVVRVPLNPQAAGLVEKYKGADPAGRLFPFISPQKYNTAIKRIFKLCNITRIVTILNPTTGKEEKRPINEIASSHLARRTFVGNLYKQVADPNLVGALSGHKEGSRAFARYRDIDDEMKRDLVNLLK